ncbi:MAG: hypothetical protein U9N32_08275, partial [Spirochaetota bacterium]|nr:hypothetical protein [Spirochaetota bacterium]
MNTVRKNTVFAILVLFSLSIVPFPLIADNLVTHTSVPSLEIFSQRINPDTSSILEYDGIKLEIPAGAVERDITIEIIKLKSAPGVNETIRNVTTGAVSYRFLPDGIHFNKNIIVSIPF